jgi:hypothetical protein
LGLFLLGQRANRDINIVILNILVMLTALNAVMDLVQLVQFSHIGIGQLRNDAAAFSAEITPLIPAAVWGFIWALLAVLMLGVSVWFSIIHPLRRGH